MLKAGLTFMLYIIFKDKRSNNVIPLFIQLTHVSCGSTKCIFNPHLTQRWLVSANVVHTLLLNHIITLNYITEEPIKFPFQFSL